MIGTLRDIRGFIYDFLFFMFFAILWLVLLPIGILIWLLGDKDFFTSILELPVAIVESWEKK